MDYKTKITAVGETVAEFLEQEIIIVYNENAPAELAEISVLHTIAELDRDVRAEDVVVLGNKDYVVTAVGGEANHTLRAMGHCTFSFKGASQVELPGHIELAGDGVPEIKAGDRFEIYLT